MFLVCIEIHLGKDKTLFDLRASHMIAAASLTLNSRPAFRTVDKVSTVLRILKEFFFILLYSRFLLAAVPWVPLHAAFEAHLEATSAHRWLASLLALLYVADAVRQGTPAQ